MTCPFDQRTWWVIGASEGLGRALSKALARRGAKLVISARSADRLEELTREINGAEALPLDVRDARALASAVQAVADAEGVIYCAGTYEPMHSLDWDEEAVERMVDINFLSAVRLLGHLVPAFARRDQGQGRGRIVMIGSLAAYVGLPRAVGYGASKAGLSSLCQTIQADLKGNGCKLQVIHPGFIRTRLTDKNGFRMPMIQSPDQAAAEVIRAIEKGRPETSFPAPFAWIFRIAALLPQRWRLAILKGGR